MIEQQYITPGERTLPRLYTGIVPPMCIIEQTS